MANSKTTLATAEGAFLAGKALFEQWKANFEVQWYQPHMDTLYGAAANKLQQLPPEVQTQSRQTNPDAWSQVDKLVRRQKNARID